MQDNNTPDMVIVRLNATEADIQAQVFEDLRVIAFKPQIAEFLGSIEAAIYFQQLLHWQKYAKRVDGFIYKSAKEIQEETCISEKIQRRCRTQLERLGWIELKKKMANGHPTYHFKVLVRSFGVLVPSGQMPVPIGQTASSITKSTTKKEHISSEVQDQIEKLYLGYIVSFKVDTDDYAYSDSDRKLSLIESAKARYKLTDKRRDAAARRLKDCGYDMCKQAIINCSKSEWHRGDDPKSKWFAHMDWIFGSYEKVEEWANKK